MTIFCVIARVKLKKGSNVCNCTLIIEFCICFANMSTEMLKNINLFFILDRRSNFITKQIISSNLKALLCNVTIYCGEN